jgi:YidC/Oxa1 family membrane protein insertase
MASDEPPNPMAESGVTIRSDSEQYSGHDELSASASPPLSSSPAVILYQPPSLWSIFRGAAINLLLPFINGMMLGFGELFAHEAAFRLGWSNTRVSLWLPSAAACKSGPLLTRTRYSPPPGGKPALSDPASRRRRSRDGETSSTT